MTVARGFLAVLVGFLVAALAGAQSPERTARIGYLVLSPPPATGSPPSPSRRAFLDRLRTLGWVEGRNLRIEYRFAERAELLPSLAADLVRTKVDVIVAASTPAINAARRVTATIPIVMPMSFDAVSEGLVASLARPGGNVTGVTLMATEIIGKRLELLKEVMPRLSHLAIVLGPPTAIDTAFVREASSAAERLRVRSSVTRITDSTTVEAEFDKIARVPDSGAIVIEHPEFLTFTSRLTFTEVTLRARVPTIFGLAEFVELGELMSYGASLKSLFERSADYVDRVLRGARPADLPVQQPVRFHLVVNWTTAQQLRLDLPGSLMARADEILGTAGTAPRESARDVLAP